MARKPIDGIKISLFSLLGITGFTIYLAFTYSITSADTQSLEAIKTVHFPAFENKVETDRSGAVIQLS